MTSSQQSSSPRQSSMKMMMTRRKKRRARRRIPFLSSSSSSIVVLVVIQVASFWVVEESSSKSSSSFSFLPVEAFALVVSSRCRSSPQTSIDPKSIPWSSSKGNHPREIVVVSERPQARLVGDDGTRSNGTTTTTTSSTTSQSAVISTDQEDDEESSSWILGLGRFTLPQEWIPSDSRVTTAVVEGDSTTAQRLDDGSVDDSNRRRSVQGVKETTEYGDREVVKGEENSKTFGPTGEKQTRAERAKGSSSAASFFTPISRVVNIEALLAFTQGYDPIGGKVADISSSDDSSTQFLDRRSTGKAVTDSANAGTMVNLTNDAGETIMVSPDDGNVTTTKTMEDLGRWVGGLRDTIGDLRQQAQSRANDLSNPTEFLMRRMTSTIGSLVDGASLAVSPAAIEAIVKRASDTVTNRTAANNLVMAAQQLALDRGLDVSEAAVRARDTTDYIATLVSVADSVLRKGYVSGDTSLMKGENRRMISNDDIPAVDASRALFADFSSAVQLEPSSMVKAAEMGTLSGAIYEDTIPRTHKLGHSIVARGCTEDVYWMVTDSITDVNSFHERQQSNRKSDDEHITKPILVRTITIRGFDASDDTVDRETLLNRVCMGEPEMIKVGPGGGSNVLMVHSGLMGIARPIYDEIKQYIQWTNPRHRIVLNGHSIGGSIANLLLILMTLDLGRSFVRKKILRVFTFGSPAVVSLRGHVDGVGGSATPCAIMEALDLPESLVHGYVQPWDPIVRLFTAIDPLYPLVGDIDDDGVTVWKSGPPRTLRPVAKAIVEAWSGWPRFRDNFKAFAMQNYTAIGIQHILLPEPTRYVADRFFAVTVTVPQVEAVVRLSSSELLSALSVVFPLDTFEISYIPQATRSFVHHFYPAYDAPLAEYARLPRRRWSRDDDDDDDATQSTLSSTSNTAVDDDDDNENLSGGRGKDGRRRNRDKMRRGGDASSSSAKTTGWSADQPTRADGTNTEAERRAGSRWGRAATTTFMVAGIVLGN